MDASAAAALASSDTATMHGNSNMILYTGIPIIIIQYTVET